MTFIRRRTLPCAVDEAMHGGDPIQHWFKYTEARWADELANEGKLRIRTLRAYRDEEQFDGGRLDEEEGETSAFVEIEHASSQDELPAFAHAGLYIDRTCHNFEIRNFRHIKRFVQPDVYVLCVSKRFDPDLLLPDFAPADACVEVVDPTEFVRALDQAMRAHGDYVGSHACEYVGRMRHYTARHTPAFVAKDPKFRHQDEVRIGWQPRAPISASHVDIHCPALRDWCRRIL